MRILAVDPGEKRLGLALSDPTGTLAAPQGVIQHRSKAEDAARIISLAEAHECGLILIGLALAWDGNETEASRRARNLAAEIRARTALPVELWDEYGSTQAAKAAALEMGMPRKKRAGHLDDRAAAHLLQSYLNASHE